jgi:amidase
MVATDWQTVCAERKEKQLQSIPKEWTIELPPEEKSNVMDVSDSCGLLTDREIQITNTVDVDILLGKLVLGEWSSVEVTTAFYKRAIIAQQLVMSDSFHPYIPL